MGRKTESVKNRMRVQIAKGETLLEALRRGQVQIEAPCNGQGTCGLCLAEVYGYGKVRTCQFIKPGIYEVKLLPQDNFAIQEEKARPNYPASQVVAIDLGTTRVAMSGNTRGETWTESFVNPQRSFGADVLSRIQSSNQGKGKELQESIWKAIEKGIRKHCASIGDNDEAEAEPQLCQIEKLNIIVSANTTMQHLLQGLSTESLGKAPFIPVDISYHKVESVDKPNLTVTYLPGISTFVGADIVSGLYAKHIMKEEKPVLFLDLGTNGEMALGNKDRLLVASTSAGPAFEASPLAMKLHASGLMKLLHQLLEDETMGDTGLLMEPYFSEGYPVSAGLVGSAKDLTFKDSKVQAEKEELPNLTQDLIRELQMAKAAIRTGIEILLKEYGVTASSVDKVYLAGGMGYYINPEDAGAIGLIPEELVDKCQAIGNSSLDGAIAFSYEEEEAREEMEAIVSLAEEVTLANHPSFESTYIRYLNF